MIVPPTPLQVRLTVSSAFIGSSYWMCIVAALEPMASGTQTTLSASVPGWLFTAAATGAGNCGGADSANDIGCGPVKMTPLMLASPLPALLTVTIFGADARYCFWLPKSSVLGETDRLAMTPVPSSEICLLGALASLFWMVSVAERLPSIVGLKTTPNVAVMLGETLNGVISALTTAKSPGLVPPMMKLLTVRSPRPVSVMVTVKGAEARPTRWLPNAIEPALTVIVGGPDEPVTVIVTFGVLGSVLLTTNVDENMFCAVGVKLRLTEKPTPGPSAIGRLGMPVMLKGAAGCEMEFTVRLALPTLLMLTTMVFVM